MIRYHDVAFDCDGLFGVTHNCKTGQLLKQLVNTRGKTVYPFVRIKGLGERGVGSGRLMLMFVSPINDQRDSSSSPV